MNTASNNISLNLGIKYPGRPWDNSISNGHVGSILKQFKANQLGSTLSEYLDKVGAEDASISFWVESESQVSVAEQALETMIAVTGFSGSISKKPAKSGKGFNVNHRLKPLQGESLDSILAGFGL